MWNWTFENFTYAELTYKMKINSLHQVALTTSLCGRIINCYIKKDNFRDKRNENKEKSKQWQQEEKKIYIFQGYDHHTNKFQRFMKCTLYFISNITIFCNFMEIFTLFSLIFVDWTVQIRLNVQEWQLQHARSHKCH